MPKIQFTSEKDEILTASTQKVNISYFQLISQKKSISAILKTKSHYFLTYRSTFPSQD
jgi:hypothetical protein